MKVAELSVGKVQEGEQYFICYAAFNATAVALSAVGSLFGTDPTADSATAVALIAPLHVMYCSPILAASSSGFVDLLLLALFKTRRPSIIDFRCCILLRINDKG